MKKSKFNNFLLSFDIDPKFVAEIMDWDVLFKVHSIEGLKQRGYHIFKNAIDAGLIDELKSYWINQKSTSIFYTSVCIGSKNYSKNFFGKYTRHFDFYWNEYRHKKTRDLSLALHAARNLMIDLDPYYGLVYDDKKIGIYQAVTHYPVGEGEMTVHVDPNYFLPVHYNLPLTHLGEDYESGGLFIVNNGLKSSIDAQMSKGDLLLFNGSVPHGIDKVLGEGRSSSIGRMQLFAIPTKFDEKRKSFLEDVAFELYGRVKYMLGKRGIGIRKDGRNFR